ncbi:hypothetical protein DLD77_06685 [Chitinophaga alhagiae]|uniref:DUF4199 domain-containing protein n=1 Tax=Chitinophaga alhagiae TaxID=2203219 RepID=A0ABN5LRC4_9BACT|nr:hypothetical protein [Chitinophaga alhagiae]AWO01399.1 hypothetical protein DLD77_06685 [Chitinophaga alhagiae]
METRLHSPLKLAVIYGVLMSLIGIVLTMVFYMTQWSSDLWTGYIANGVLFVGVLLFIIHVNKAMGGRASLSNLFVMGLLASAIFIVMVSTAHIIFHLATEPPPGTTGNLPSDGTRMSEYSSYKREGFWIFLLGNLFVTNAVLGGLASVIGAVTVKRNQKTTDAR